MAGYQEIDSLDAFRAQIQSNLNSLPPSERSVFIFIHGYNVPYSAGIYRHAQMAKDFGGSGVPVHFSWPSAGRAPAYLYDGDSAGYARDGLADVLKMAATLNASEVVLLAHSMGTLLTMEAIRTLSLKGEANALKTINPVVLAAPDIDVDVFRSQLRTINPRPEPFVVLVSSDDQALRVSNRVRGGTPRVGQGAINEELSDEGIVVLNLTDLSDSSDRTNHSKFASSPTFIRLISSGTISPDTFRETGGTSQTETGVGAVSDLLSSIIYLPARALGER